REQKHPAAAPVEPTDSTGRPARTTTGRTDRFLTRCCRDCDFRKSFSLLCATASLSHCCGRIRGGTAGSQGHREQTAWLFVSRRCAPCVLPPRFWSCAG